jgi:hypothetical protein
MEKGRVRTSFDLPEGLWQAVKVQANREGIELRELVIAALEKYIGPKFASPKPSKGPTYMDLLPPDARAYMEGIYGRKGGK